MGRLSNCAKIQFGGGASILFGKKKRSEGLALEFHHKPWMQGYLEVNEDLLAFVRRGSFSKHLYQFGDLRPDQARQSVWEMAWEGRVVRVEITPNNAITAAYYSMGDYMTAMDANRASLPFPSKGW